MNWRHTLENRVDHLWSLKIVVVRDKSFFFFFLFFHYEAIPRPDASLPVYLLVAFRNDPSPTFNMTHTPLLQLRQVPTLTDY